MMLNLMRSILTGTPKLEDIDLSGILVKRGASIRNWKARYFLVRGEHIIYFKHETDNTPIGQISFKGHTIYGKYKKVLVEAVLF